MQHTFGTVQCYPKNKFYLNYYTEVTTPRISLPFSLMHVILTTQWKEEVTQICCLQGSLRTFQISYNSASQKTYIWQIPYKSKFNEYKAEVELSTSELSSAVNPVSSLSLPLDMCMPVAPWGTGNQTRKLKPKLNPDLCFVPLQKLQGLPANPLPAQSFLVPSALRKLWLLLMPTSE